MFGIRRKAGGKLYTSDQDERTYSRFEPREPRTLNTEMYSRFSHTRCRELPDLETPLPVVQDVAPQMAEDISHPTALAQDLYSEAPVPLALLRRALPQRFEDIQSPDRTGAAFDLEDYECDPTAGFWSQARTA